MYTLLFQKLDSLGADLNQAATSGTLSSGSFGSPTGEQLLVVDYNNTKAEVIKCTIAGTSLTGITRGVDGTADVDHSDGAPVIMAFVPSHYSAITDGTGFATGSSSVGIPAAAMKREAWADWTPTYSANGSMTFTSVTTTQAKYIRIGNIVYWKLNATGTVGGTPSNELRFTAPVNRASTVAYESAGCGNANNAQSEVANVIWNGASQSQIVVGRTIFTNNFAIGTAILTLSGFYEA